MIDCYATGIFPRPEELIEATRAYDRGKLGKEELDKYSAEAAREVIEAQVNAGLAYITDGMLKWQDPLRPFTENISGVEAGALTRWFNNNTFYRKPIITGRMTREISIVSDITYVNQLPRDIPWKAILPAPYTFAKCSTNQFYKDTVEPMFRYAQILREEIKTLAGIGFKYIQLSDPALVYGTRDSTALKDVSVFVKDALNEVVKGINVKTCLQTFFGDFTRLLPDVLDFSVDHLGIDLQETNLAELKKYKFDKGIALGIADSRNSILEDQNELISLSEEVIESIFPSKIYDVFVCPNCDLEFLPWDRAKVKMETVSRVAKALRGEFNA